MIQKGGVLRRWTGRTRLPQRRARHIPDGPPSSRRHQPFLRPAVRSEEHTSELQSHLNLVFRLLLEKKKRINSLEMVESSFNSLLTCCLRVPAAVVSGVKPRGT